MKNVDRSPQTNGGLKNSDAYYYRMHNALPWVPGCGKGTYTVRDKGVFRTCTVLDSSYNIAAPRTPEKIGSCNALS